MQRMFTVTIQCQVVFQYPIKLLFSFWLPLAASLNVFESSSNSEDEKDQSSSTSGAKILSKPSKSFNKASMMGFKDASEKTATDHCKKERDRKRKKNRTSQWDVKTVTDSKKSSSIGHSRLKDKLRSRPKKSSLKSSGIPRRSSSSSSSHKKNLVPAKDLGPADPDVLTQGQPHVLKKTSSKEKRSEIWQWCP